ncbi:hypothetical protein JG688_00011500 [Phytophthora aleatoria]|uniref:Uncharacterized protein n=1 Tax=Phytophthora aleatoria TaxID=2496075 RepID=A0A8J5J0G3_9STRA|nr:hypothetical protein JG688_00011500 [Phytophthora aleatoria]
MFARSLYRICQFVVANLDVASTHNTRRVQRTLHEVNHHLDAVYVRLASDAPYWWREFSAAASRIAFSSRA